MNDTQKAEFKALVAGDFGYLSFIFDPKVIPPSVAKHAFKALRDQKMSEEIIKQYAAEFASHQIFEEITQILRIMEHPCPQNRATGCSGIYATYTADDHYIGENILQDGVDNIHGIVYWHDGSDMRNQCREKIGLLGLTAKQGENEAPLTKEDLLKELFTLIQASYIEYLESINQQLESKSLSENSEPYPRLDFSPAQITCQITGKIFHTPVKLITLDQQCSGMIEKERALSIIDAAKLATEPPCCPITRKPLLGFVVCTSTIAMANQFWDKLQSGSFSQEFCRYEPKPQTLTRPDCVFLEQRQERPNRLVDRTAQEAPNANRNRQNPIDIDRLRLLLLQPYGSERLEAARRLISIFSGLPRREENLGSTNQDRPSFTPYQLLGNALGSDWTPHNFNRNPQPNPGTHSRLPRLDHSLTAEGNYDRAVANLQIRLINAHRIYDNLATSLPNLLDREDDIASGASERRTNALSSLRTEIDFLGFVLMIHHQIRFRRDINRFALGLLTEGDRRRQPNAGNTRFFASGPQERSNTLASSASGDTQRRIEEALTTPGGVVSLHVLALIIHLSARFIQTYQTARRQHALDLRSTLDGGVSSEPVDDPTNTDHLYPDLNDDLYADSNDGSAAENEDIPESDAQSPTTPRL